MSKISGKTAIITGASRGIGEATARLFVDQGANVVLLARSASQIEAIAKDIGNAALAVPCDVSKYAEMEAAVAQAHAHFGSVDILINNAGIGFVGNIEQTEEEDFDRLYQVNVKGVFNCVKAILPRMKKQGGVIVNMASIVSHIAVKDRLAYTTTKGAVWAMTNSIAKDYLANEIRCNSVSPARVHTPFVDDYLEKNYPGREKEMYEKLSQTQPIGRMAKPQEVADLVLYLCSDEASFITGTDFPIDGGFIKLNGN